MGSQPTALEKLFDEWKEKHEKNLSANEPYLMTHDAPYGKFVRDGIVNIENWKKQKFRICFILNEAGGYDDNEKFPEGHDVAAEWNEKGSFTKFMVLLSLWTQAINDAMVPPVDYNKKKLLREKDELIRSISLVNIKKSDGQVRSDFHLLRRFAENDAEEIRKELEIVKANIIICSGNFNMLHGPRLQPVSKGEEGETAADENAKPELAEPAVRNRVFYDDEFYKLTKRAYKWGNSLVFDMWTTAQFANPLAQKDVNYYAVREVCRTAVRAFNEYSKNQAAKKAKLKAKEEAQAAAKTKKPKAKAAAKPKAVTVKPKAKPKTEE